MGVMTYGSLGGGILTGAFREPRTFAPSDSRNRFSTGLQISTRNRIGVLSDAMLVFATGKINVRDMSARDLEGGYGVINVLVDVTSVHQLNNIISRLRSVKGVVDVTRTVDTN